MRPNLSVEQIAGALAVLGASVLIGACGGEKAPQTPVNSKEVAPAGEHKPGEASCGAGKGAGSCGAGKGAGSCGAGKSEGKATDTNAAAGGGDPKPTDAKPADPKATDTKAADSKGATATPTPTPTGSGTAKKPTTPAPAGSGKKGGGASCGAGTCSTKK